MSTLKNKLANSVRQAKANANLPEAPSPAAGHTPPAPGAAAAPADPKGHPSTESTQNPAPSAREIFPRRIWPD